MVDSIWGNAAGLPARLGLQTSVGWDPVNGKVLDGKVLDGKAVEAPRDLGPRRVDSQPPGVVSEGRATVRAMTAEPPVDTARVAELKDAIASGRYKVDPDRIADAMLRSEPGLFRS
ncbi:MAG: flagellar biosynthesis anti-sigma factor FlgM [Sandaracinobacter sp.]